MSEPNNNPGGDPVNNPVDDPGHNVDDRGKDSVQYSTYQRTVSEAKKAKERAAQLEQELNDMKAAKEAERQEQLKKNEEWQTLAEEREQRRLEAENQLNALREQDVYRKKMARMQKELPGVDLTKYHNLIESDEIKVTDAGDFDDDSVKKVVEGFRNSYPELISVSNSADFDGKPPKPNSVSKLTPEEFARLPKHEKAKRASELASTDSSWIVNGVR